MGLTHDKNIFRLDLTICNIHITHSRNIASKRPEILGEAFMFFHVWFLFISAIIYC